MSRKGKLTNVCPQSSAQKLTNRSKSLFKIILTEKIENNYSFKSLDHTDCYKFCRFLEEIVGKPISDVDNQYLRKPDLDDKYADESRTLQIQHYGKSRSPLRLHGYWISEGFVVIRIDAKHKVHKS